MNKDIGFDWIFFQIFSIGLSWKLKIQKRILLEVDFLRGFVIGMCLIYAGWKIACG